MSPRSLQIIGYWRSEREPHLPDPADWVDPDYPELDREIFADYLDSGILVRQYLGLSDCRICGITNGSAELTDGRFVWPTGLSHYVRDHSVRLPPSIERALLASFESLGRSEFELDLWRRATAVDREEIE